MVKKVLVIEVQDGDLDNLQGKLEGTGARIRDVETNTVKADASLKNLADNGEAISILDSFTGGLATRLRDAAEATKLFNLNLKGTRGALLATGIGALVVALGAVVAYWDDIKTFVTGINQELKTQLMLQKEISEEADFNLQILESSENILKLQGKTEQEIINLKKERLKEIIKISEEELLLQQQQLEHAKNSESTIQGQGERFLKFFGKITFKISEMLDKATGGIFNFTKGAAIAQVNGASIIEGLFGNEDEIKKIEKNIDDLTLKVTGARDRLAAIEIESRNQEQPNREETEESNTLPLTGITGLEGLQGLVDGELEILTAADRERTKREREESEARVRARMFEVDAKDEILQQEAGLLDQFGQFLSIAGQKNKELAIAGIVAQKIASIARTISATGAANARAKLELGPIAGTAFSIQNSIAAGLSIAGTTASAAQAISQLGGGSAGSTPSFGGGTQSTPPAFNIVDNSAQNQLNNALVNDLPEAIVLEGAVTNAQEAKRKMVRATSF